MPLAASFNFYLSKLFFPDIVGFFAHLGEVFPQHFGFQVMFGILYACEGEAYFQFQRHCAFAVLETDNRYAVVAALLLDDFVDIVVCHRQKKMRPSPF